MNFETLKAAIPDYAKDLRLNLSGITTVTTLTPQQLWGTALSSALATGNAEVIAAVFGEAAGKLDDAAVTAAKAAASIMAMNNIYYRFTHLAKNKDYMTMPARLRMNVIGQPGVDKVDFEMWCLAVSAIHGCGRCIEAHEDELVAKSVSKEAIQDVIRVAAILHGVAMTLTSDAALPAQSAAAA